MTPALRSLLLSAVPLLALAACAEGPLPYYTWRTHAEIVEFAPEPLYCYRTLARPTCYAQPLDATQTDRLVGYYGPPPGRVVPVLVPVNGKTGVVIDHPPLTVPRETVESAPLSVSPPPPSIFLPSAPALAPAAPVPLTPRP